MSVITLLSILAGLVLLVAGANILVKGASNLALGWGISPLVVGLTVVAYGTSAPEMAVSVAGAVGDSPDVALGNVLGSTVCNVLLILGLSAVAGSLVVARRLVQVEVPLMIALSLIVFAMAYDQRISRIDGVILVMGAILYTAYTVRSSLKERGGDDAKVDDAKDDDAKEGTVSQPTHVNLGFVVGGIVALVAGSQLLVSGAVDIAEALGLSELVIGLTIVAIGTSLPEVATSIAATLKGDRDIAVGNVIGSNLFNLSAVLGLSSAVAPSGLPVADGLLRFDFPIAIAACVACLPIFFTGHKVMRWEGFVFLGYYAAYLSYLVLRAGDHERTQDLENVMLLFVVPLTIVTMAVLVTREVQARRNRNQSLASPKLSTDRSERTRV